jgi:hypothetical protein
MDDFERSINEVLFNGVETAELRGKTVPPTKAVIRKGR